MNVLVRAVRDFRRLATPNLGFTLGIAGGLLAIEALGRYSSTDLHDLLALSIVAVLAALVIARHRRAPLAWMAALGRHVDPCIERLKRCTFEIGLDLRGTPPVKRGASADRLGSGVGPRNLGRNRRVRCPVQSARVAHLALYGSYVLYLVPLALVWFGTIMLTLLSAFLPWAMMHDAFIAAHSVPGPRPRRREFVASLAYFIGLLLLGVFLPVGVSLLACAGFLIAYVLVCRLPARSSVQLSVAATRQRESSLADLESLGHVGIRADPGRWCAAGRRP